MQRDGGFADHVLVPHSRYLLDYGSLPEAQACTCACAGLTAYSALKKLGPLAAADRLLIVGAGGVGLSAIRLARQMFETPPIVVGIDQRKWDTALQAGAGEMVDPAADGALRALVKASVGGVAASTFAFGFGALRKGGRLVSVGLFGGATLLVPAMVAMKSVAVIGSYVGTLAEMRELMTIAGRLPALPLTTQPLAKASQALADLKAGRVLGRIVLQP